MFFSTELVTEDALLSWISLRAEEEEDSAKGKLFQQPQVQAFVAWIQEEEESSDEDGDDDDDDDEEE